MSEEKKDYVVGTGPDGEPVVKFSNNPAINSILTEKALEEDVAGIEEVLNEADYVAPVLGGAAPSAMAIRSVASKTSNVEVIPGVMVSQHLIDAAVGASTADSPKDHLPEGTYHRQLSERKQKMLEELREDISASQKFVQEMVDRMRNPGRYDEKYVSFDQMPQPLQRVVTAYMAVSDANKELEEAIKALQQLQVTPKAA